MTIGYLMNCDFYCSISNMDTKYFTIRNQMFQEEEDLSPGFQVPGPPTHQHHWSWNASVAISRTNFTILEIGCPAF